MKSGYKLFWSESAILDLENILGYLLNIWSESVAANFSKKLENRLELLKYSPNIFPLVDKRNTVRKSVLTKHIVIYYEVSGERINILTLFDTRQNPEQLKKRLE